MFRAINLKEKSYTEVAGKAFANENVMQDFTNNEKTIKLVKRVNRSGIFKVIEGIKTSIN